jgi:NAD(P)-dependent dehydrogenase (short-subunit alcohol dehydrogenase family)
MGGGASRHWSFKDMPDLTGRIILITGANQGLGKGVVESFIEHSNCEKIIMACRSEERAKAAIDDIVAKTKVFPGAAATKDRLELLILDLGDLEQIPKAAEDLKKRFDRIDICINNAGIGGFGVEGTTKQGFEICMGTNHYGHFLFNALIFPLILASKAKTGKPARLVSVASVAHESTKGIDFEDINWDKRKRDALMCYCDSKLANVHYMYGLGKRLKERGLDGEVTVTSLQPGFAGSGLYRDFNCVLRAFVTQFMATNPKNLAANEVRAATDESFTTGTYTNPARSKFWGPPVLAEPTDVAKDEQRCDRLWQITEEKVGQKFFKD